MPFYLFSSLFAMMFNDPITLPSIQLQKGEWSSLPQSTFLRATDGTPADFPTNISLMADETHLHIQFECERDMFVEENYLTNHNEPLYNQEVFELFIAAGTDDPAQYLEFEINPNNAVWIGKITNKGMGDTGSPTADMVAYDSSGITHAVVKAEGKWSGSFSIPWRLISSENASAYRLNFYRIVSVVSHPNEDWVCGSGTEFLCWSPTMSGAEPAFHRPKRFGYLIIN